MSERMPDRDPATRVRNVLLISAIVIAVIVGAAYGYRAADRWWLGIDSLEAAHAQMKDSAESQAATALTNDTLHDEKIAELEKSLKRAEARDAELESQVASLTAAVERLSKPKAPTPVKPRVRPAAATRRAPAVVPVVYRGSVPTLIRSIAKSSGYGSADTEALVTLAKRESSFNPRARNGNYYGLYQLNSGMALGNPWYDPAWNTRRAIRYIKGRYGTPRKALAFHRSRGWY